MSRRSFPSSGNGVKPPRCPATPAAPSCLPPGQAGSPSNTHSLLGGASYGHASQSGTSIFHHPLPPQDRAAGPRPRLRKGLGAAATAAPTALRPSHRTGLSRCGLQVIENMFSVNAYVLLERALNTRSSDSLTCVWVAMLPGACFGIQAAHQIVSHSTPCACLFLVKCGIVH